MKFYTLIHVCEDEQSLHNNGFGTSFKDQIKLYFSCARQLHRSLKEEGIELVVLTNDAAFLNHINNGSYQIEVVQIDFVLNVPSGLKFYSAHFKIEVYQYLSLLNEDYVGLIDCDMICINKIPACLRNAINYKTPLYYDITDQMNPAFGAERIIKDKQQLGKTKSIGLWAGGEFICGKPSFFSVLYQEIERIKDDYFENFNSFQHQGDEMLTSVAIERLMLTSDLRILDVGVMSIVGRYWSYKPLHHQKAIEAYADHFLLHIPSDKKFIAGLKENELKAEAFFKSYKKHLFKFHLLENTLGGFKPYVKKVTKSFLLTKPNKIVTNEKGLRNNGS
jgi:hypothetical protein